VHHECVDGKAVDQVEHENSSLSSDAWSIHCCTCQQPDTSLR
jgi:hypothetical protein